MRKRVTAIIMAMCMIMSPMVIVAEETDYSFLDDMTIEELTALDEEIHRRIENSEEQEVTDEKGNDKTAEEVETVVITSEALQNKLELYNDMGIVVTVDDINYDSASNFYNFQFKVDNTSDRTVFAAFEDVTVNRFQMSSYYYDPINWVTSGHIGLCDTMVLNDDVENAKSENTLEFEGKLNIWEKGADNIISIPIVIKGDIFGYASDGSDINQETATASASDEILVFDKEGIKVFVTGMDEPDRRLTKIRLRVENLNHHNIGINTSDYKMVINGVMIDSPLWVEVKSGKTSNSAMEFYEDSLQEAGIDKIKDLSFTIKVFDSDTYDDLYIGDRVFLTVTDDNKVVSQDVYTDRESIRKVQELLNAAGYDCGSADGIPGKKTNSAILEFERDHALPENTDITPELMAALEKARQ